MHFKLKKNPNLFQNQACWRSYLLSVYFLPSAPKYPQVKAAEQGILLSYESPLLSFSV